MSCGAGIHDIETPVGTARTHRWSADPAGRRGTLVLGHGAGGRSWSKDLLALTSLAGDGWDVILVEQPWRVAGRKVAGPPKQLDAAWTAVLADLRAGWSLGRAGEALVVGGRSAGARVACRTCQAVGADAVLALAFPLHPPGKPERSRAAELTGAGALPVFVVQGRADPFGRPEEFHGLLETGVELVAVAGGHGFSANTDEVVIAVREWLAAR